MTPLLIILMTAFSKGFNTKLSSIPPLASSQDKEDKQKTLAAVNHSPSKANQAFIKTQQASLEVNQASIKANQILADANQAPNEANKTSVEAIPDWLARWELARVLSYQKKYEESIKEYQKLLDMKPELTEAKIEMAKVFSYQGKKAEALSILEHIPLQVLDDATKTMIANIYASNKQYDRAEPLYQEYLTKHPNDLKVRLKFAEMLSWQKRYPESIREYEKILQERPHDIQLRRKYAFVLIWMGKNEEGIQELKQTLN